MYCVSRDVWGDAINSPWESGRYKTWTVDSGLDHGLDYGPALSRALVYAE